MIRSLNIIFLMTSFILLINQSTLFACHLKTGIWDGYMFDGHIVEGKKPPEPKFKPAYNWPFGVTTDITVGLSNITQGTTDNAGKNVQALTASFATTTQCDWMKISNINKFFKESYLHIAEESALGQGPYLDALVLQVGCNENQSDLLESTMKKNYSDLFAKNDFNESIEKFYQYIFNNKELKKCWYNSTG